MTTFVHPNELVAHILFECANFLEEFHYAGFGTHILDVFENCIAIRVSILPIVISLVRHPVDT